GKWTTTTDFVFRINYWQSDNLAPGAIQLFVRKVGEDGSPLTSWMGYSMSKVYPADSTYTDGCLYYEELNSVQLPGGGVGDYQYYFQASDGVRTAIYPNRPSDDPGYIGVPPGDNDYYWFRVNDRPTLADQSLVPVSGPQRGDFAWEVTYADQDGEVYDAAHAGDPPFKSILWLDLFGDVEGQAEVNGAPSGNVITYTVPGTAYADNALVGMKVRMQTGAEAGQQFTITANNQGALTITATGVSTSGIADGDLFNIAHWSAKTMDAVSPGDTNYRDGAVFDFSTARAGVQLDPGIHHYYFEFWDNWAYWINWQQYFMTSDPDPIDQKVEGQMVRLPAQGYYEGPEVLEEIPPILSSYYFAPPVADQITGVDVGTDTIEYDRAGDLPGYGTNDVQSMYLEILGGFAQFKVFPILSNTDTEIELNTTSISMDGVQVGNRFRIYEDRTQDTSTGKWYQSWGYDSDPGSADDYDGTPATPFYFYVLYTDADNNAPQAIRLQIDDDAGQVYEMEKVVPGDINYAAGVLYRTSAQVYMAEGSHTFEAQAWDGASWYNGGSLTDFWGPYGYTGSSANGPDIAPNAAPQLSFKVGENLEIASVDPTDPYIFTYTEPTDPDEALGDDPITAVYISAVGHNYSTDSPGGGYVVSTHDPATNTIELADEGLDLSSNVSDTFTAAAELVPRTGFSDQTYRYYVVYTDTDTYAGTTGNPATFVNAYIDAAEYAMGEYDPTDLDVSDGKVYYYDMSSLSPSPAHTYYFMASDGVDNVRFPPAPNYFEGPLVTVNGPPNPPPYPPADGWSPINGVSVDTQTPTLDWPAGSDDDPWDSPSSFTYIVQLSMTADLSTVDHEYDTTDYGGPGITELDVPDDLDWAWWYWRVQTVDGHGLGSAWSAIHYFKVDQTPQPPTSGFSPASAPAPAGTIGTLTPTLQWDPGTDPDADDPPEEMRYHVELDDDADFTSPIVSPDLGGPGDPEYGVTGVGVTSFQVDISLGLEANTPYHWRVRTVNGLESAWSITKTFTVVIPTYSLSGTIYDSDTVTPLEGVTVECYNSLAVKVREEDTEADGEYEFTGLPADTYQVVPVFDPFSFTPVGGDDHVTIVDSDITDFDFNLVDGAYKITGTITITGGGGPLEDAVVSIGIRSDDTNASGYYEITGLHDGNYTLAVTAPAGQYYTFTPDGWTQPVTISGSDQTGRDFDADEETFDVSGTVKDYDANLLGGIDIDAVKVGAPSSTASTTTAGNGTYTLADLSAGDWEITATDPGDTFVFVPSLATVTVPGPGGSDVEDIDFTGYPGSEHSYAVGLHLTGVPVYPIEGYAEDVFLSSDIWWWHPSGGVYIGTGHPDAGSLLQVLPGTGFFVDYSSATDIKVAGTAVPTGVPFVKNLGPAWNMIANPFDGYELPMANIQPDTGHVILPFAYIYDSFSGSYLLVTDQAGIGVARSYLEPWEGAWLYACTPTNFTIEMTAGPLASAAGAEEEVSPQALDTGQAGWVVPVLAHVGNRSDLMGAIGISSIEPYSLPNPPAALNSVDLYFVGEGGSQLAQSVVSATGDAASWEFVVATDIPDSQVEVALPDLSQLPNDLVVTLTDLDADRAIYARTMPSYSFRSGEDGAVRHFRIEVGPKQAGGLAITTAAAQPGGSGAVITYGVSQACTVTVEVMNISGRVIKTLVAAEAATAGTHALSWNLRSNSGTVVPRGMYLVRIDAAAENGQRTSRLCQLSVSR
ncbi:MAG: hypothetical protein KAW89_06900, partial [Armatimonadetes bacterium]|nr:hypothetical protein [Armatimonadota bacterium]